MNHRADPVVLQFSEVMKGFVTFGQVNYDEGYERGKRDDTTLTVHLTIRTDDLDHFLDTRDHEAEAIGYITCDRLGGHREVTRGSFNLFVDTADLNAKKMRYRLLFTDARGSTYTLSGYKKIQDNVGPDTWKDTTTLFINLFEGHVTLEQEPSSTVVAAGVVKIELSDFLKQLTTFRTTGATFGERVKAMGRFGRFFIGSLWDVYGPSTMPDANRAQREIPLYTTEGVSGATISTHPFVTADKLSLTLSRFHRAPCDDVVVIIHGLTTSTDMFIMPEHYNLVQFLLNNGFTDVWTLDYRMSNRFGYNLSRNRFNMDDIALYDYPQAIATMREVIGPHRRLHVICHCLGSVSFMMSLFGKATTGITSVIANSAALTPRIPRWSCVKLRVGPFMSDYVLGIEYMNPYWRVEPGWSIGKLIGWAVSQVHRECDVPACHMLSFMWGSGSPALYSHENLDDVTHRRGGDLYGGVSVHYYRHVNKMVSSNNTAVKYDPRDERYRSLPDNYFEHAKEIQTPVLLVTGEINRVFTDSNIMCHRRLEQLVPGRHELHVFPGYGHQDVFMGKNCAVDIFPRMLQFLKKHSGRP